MVSQLRSEGAAKLNWRKNPLRWKILSPQALTRLLLLLPEAGSVPQLLGAGCPSGSCFSLGRLAVTDVILRRIIFKAAPGIKPKHIASSSMKKRHRSCASMACRPQAGLAPSRPALKRWLWLGLLVFRLVSLGYAVEKKMAKGKVGEKVGLPCCHEIPSTESLRNYRVYWQKNTTEVVLAYAEGKKISENERYKNRTELNMTNLTLWISPVEILDNGPYQCVVQHLKVLQNSVAPRIVCDEPVTLFITADFSEPNITAEVRTSSCESDEVVVRCSSHGGFPKPKISGALNNESVVWNATWVSEAGISPYNVTGNLRLNVTEDTSLTCSIEYNGFAKSTSLLLKKRSDCVLPTIPPSYNVITASSIIIIVFLLAVTLAARFLPRHEEEDVKESMKTAEISKVTSETSSV
ncbi:T-lymphocyte activation antigen CD80 isoform X2 [Struthio camelus]|uniref:T-lymphocyte activation antigen CD80 isoform X2 n=1 Tax=Struthio camelus TaxID=8801 RepID=UPI003603D97F